MKGINIKNPISHLLLKPPTGPASKIKRFVTFGFLYLLIDANIASNEWFFSDMVCPWIGFKIVKVL